MAVGASLALNIIDSAVEAATDKGNAQIGDSRAVATTDSRDDVYAYATARGLKIERYLNKFKVTYDDIINGKYGTDEQKSLRAQKHCRIKCQNG